MIVYLHEDNRESKCRNECKKWYLREPVCESRKPVHKSADYRENDENRNRKNRLRVASRFLWLGRSSLYFFGLLPFIDLLRSIIHENYAYIDCSNKEYEAERRIFSSLEYQIQEIQPDYRSNSKSKPPIATPYIECNTPYNSRCQSKNDTQDYYIYDFHLVLLSREIFPQPNSND